MPTTEAIALLVVLVSAACNAQLAGAAPHAGGAGGARPRRALLVSGQHHQPESWKVQPSADIMIQGARQPISNKDSTISRHLHPDTLAVASPQQKLATPAAATPPAQNVRLLKNLVEFQDRLLLPSEQLTESCNRLRNARHRAPVLA